LSFAGILSSSTKLLQLLLQIPTKLPNETKTQNNNNNKKASVMSVATSTADTQEEKKLQQQSRKQLSI